ncbi:hypothetical protein KIN20_019762 [Parelaphostrongylus tenuis]|uniref:Uncharacterized protein n=1 Tax=Parelaphostrongylus tenuis TaxID=148309 RepID=A0AAD5N591_PARTN|nr:hypothetical protein KIN20_019762 [Parelaphostrongylus tenuis]
MDKYDSEEKSLSERNKKLNKVRPISSSSKENLSSNSDGERKKRQNDGDSKKQSEETLVDSKRIRLTEGIVQASKPLSVTRKV